MSQRGDSGSLLRNTHTMNAPSAPKISSHRQPSMSRCSSATNRPPRNAATGTPQKPTVYAHAM